MPERGPSSSGAERCGSPAKLDPAANYRRSRVPTVLGDLPPYPGTVTQADSFSELLAEWEQFTESRRTDGHLRVVLDGASDVFDARSVDGLGTMIEATLEGPADLDRFTLDGLNDYVWVEVDFGTEDREPTYVRFEVTSWNHDTVAIEFEDGSTRVDSIWRPPPDQEVPFDTGVQLLQPITVVELRGIESILGVLERAIERSELSEFEERRILAMAEVIREARLEAEPGTTLRWKLIGAVRCSLRYVYKEAPKDFLAWWKVTDLLSEINWTDLAQQFPG